MALRRGGDGAGGHCCCTMRPLSRHITVLYTTMVLSFILMFHAALVDADVLVYRRDTHHPEGVEFPDAPARFGGQIPMDGIKGNLVKAFPEDGCSALDRPPKPKYYSGKWFVLIKRYGCKFEDKVRNAELAGFDLAIIHNVNSSALEPMSADHLTNISIPSVFVGEDSGIILKENYLFNFGFYIFINDNLPFNINTHLLLPFAIVVGICFMVMMIIMIVKCVKERLHARRHRLPSSSLKKIPVLKFKKNDPSNTFDTCAICLEDYLDGDKLRVLPCAHAYHCKCIDPWLTCNRRVCPMCKRKVFAADERIPSDDDDDDDEPRQAPAQATGQDRAFVVSLVTSLFREPEEERAPLIRGSTSQPRRSQRGRPRGGGTFQPQRENPFRRASRQQNQNARGNRPEPDTSSEYSTTSESSGGQPSPPTAASSDESLAQVATNPESENLVDAAGPSSSSPRLSVNSSRDEVQEVAVVPQAEPQAGGRSWWSSLWSRSVDA
ncbi:E3 ubiquitin-protein ligase RNF13-like [Ischnura elegans]|uniref:E3 ubiquitin-protein ligase RNF13-like n=1 Tax=Ischnura elegans TaxID=197161 RepID=UPI001ED8ADB1|nr:E3 ubiquitin-protein ligase RNF13-like [Ischnura elegans]XP_046392202.1 E3 ubiquitin-protein ligase RNF13-like [Ischnura elegans]XP_046392203.1 E3 ubiquitin-protein ligase RNF13-like [Ischnura elegans]XP_046392204.1 E3 ubiquitin-protein ligase RNF13-like [Ischnura elegans]